MAKTRTYIVSFNRAERTDRGFYRVSFDIGKPNVNHQVTCHNFTQLEDEVRHLAAEFGLPCSSYIRLPKGERNPPGFDKFCKTLNIIDAPQTVAA
jgi:hypothetical protein